MTNKALIRTLLLIALLLVPSAGAAQCTVFKTWRLGEIPTSSDVNSAFSRVVTANAAACAAGDSASVSAMRATLNPYPGSVESLATTVAGELERIRYQLAAVVGKSYWYQPVDSALATGVLKHWGATYTTFYKISDPTTPGAGNIALYAKDNGAGVFVLAYKSSAGLVTSLTGPSTSFGSTITTNLRIIRNAATPKSKLDLSADRISVAGYICAPVAVTIDAGTTGVNALDTGKLANGTLYYVWIVYNVRTAACAGLASLSETAPTLPLNYTLKRVVGAFRTNSSSEFLDGIQKDDTFVYAEPVLVGANLAQTTSTALDMTGFVPAKAVLEVLLNVFCQSQVRGMIVLGPTQWTGAVTAGKATHTGVTMANSQHSGGCPASRAAVWLPTLNVNPPTIYYAADDKATVSNLFVVAWRIAWRE